MKPEIRHYVDRGIEAEIKEHRERIAALTELKRSVGGKRKVKARRRHLTKAQRIAISKRMRAMWAKKRDSQ